MIKEIQEIVQLIRLLSEYTLSPREMKCMYHTARKMIGQTTITDQEVWELYVKQYEAEEMQDV